MSFRMKVRGKKGGLLNRRVHDGPPYPSERRRDPEKSHGNVWAGSEGHVCSSILGKLLSDVGKETGTVTWDRVAVSAVSG